MKPTYSIEELVIMGETMDPVVGDQSRPLEELINDMVDMRQSPKTSAPALAVEGNGDSQLYNPYTNGEYFDATNLDTVTSWTSIPLLYPQYVDPSSYLPCPGKYPMMSSMMPFGDRHPVALNLSPLLSRNRKTNAPGYDMIGKENIATLPKYLPPGARVIKVEPGMPVPVGAIRISASMFQNYQNKHSQVDIGQDDGNLPLFPFHGPIIPMAVPYKGGDDDNNPSTTDSKVSSLEQDGKAPSAKDDESAYSTLESSSDSHSIQIQLPQ